MLQADGVRASAHCFEPKVRMSGDGWGGRGYTWDNPSSRPMSSDHGIAWPIHVYALIEQVRRFERGLSLDACRADIARLFEHFSAVAAAHPYAQFPVAHDAAFLRTLAPQNYLLPYTRWMVAQDAVNQGAALVMTSVGGARELGIPEARWI